MSTDLLEQIEDELVKELAIEFVRRGLSPRLAIIAAKSDDPEGAFKSLKDELAVVKSNGVDEQEIECLLAESEEALAKGDMVASIKLKNQAYRLRQKGKK